jgi:hypothetical protein
MKIGDHAAIYSDAVKRKMMLMQLYLLNGAYALMQLE